MPLLRETDHMQLWCPEARVVIAEGGGSPALNRIDMGQITGLKVPITALCFGRRCGAWRWSNMVKGSDDKFYTPNELLTVNGNLPRAKQITYEHLGFCGKAGPAHPDKVPEFTPPPSDKAPATDNVVTLKKDAN